MTVQEAIKVFEKPSDHIKTIPINNVTGIIYSGDLVKAFEMAIEALGKQSKLKNVIRQIQELANEFQEGDYHEVHCKNREDNCKWKDCSACVLERAIEIIKEELM